jgi:PAS domain S-box-containing protein
MSAADASQENDHPPGGSTPPLRAVQASLSQIQRLLENEHLWYRLLSEGAVEGTALISDGIILAANRQLALMLGAEVTDLTGASIADFVDDGPVAEARAQLRMGVTTPYGMTVRRRDGATFPAEIYATMVEVDGQWFRVTNVIDISERRRVESAMREKDVRLRAYFDQSPSGMAVLSLEDSVLEANAALYALLDRPPSALGGIAFSELIHPEERGLYSKLATMLFAGDIPRFSIESRLTGKDRQPSPVRLSLSVIQDSDGSALHALAVVEDLVAQKKLEEELHLARLQLDNGSSRPAAGRNPYGLTLRELTVLHKMATGRSDKQIAAELMISHYTAQKHVANILAKMTGSSRTEAAVRAVREGLIA